MAPITVINVPRRGSRIPAALSFVQGVPAKRKAAEVTSSSDTSTAARRQKTVHDISNPQAPGKTLHTAKEASRRPHTAPAATADSTLATNVALTPGPAASDAPLPFVASDAPVAAQDNTLHPAATSTSTLLPPPKYNPDACFTISLPAPVTPWPHDFPAPTPRLTHTLTACPVDWGKVPTLGGKDIEAYELRTPWNPHPVTFEVVAQRTTHPGNGGKQPSMEAVRKRFKNVNAAIFKRTGVYFPESSQGLEVWGIKKPVTTMDTTPPPPPPSDEWTIYQGDIVAVQLKGPTDKHTSIRVCDAKLIPAYDELVSYEEMLDEDKEPYMEAIVPLLPFSTKAFDHWHASICHGTTPRFPKRTLLCKRIGQVTYMLRVNSRARRASARLMLETYVVSRAMGTTEASDMMLAELKKKLNSPSTPTLDDVELQPMQHLQSDDPVREVVSRFRWRTAGESPGSEYSAKDDEKV